MNFGISFSNATDERTAVREAVTDAISQSNGSDLLVLFSCDFYDQSKLLSYTLELTDKVVGCTTAKVIGERGLVNGIGAISLKGIKAKTKLIVGTGLEIGEEAGKFFNDFRDGTVIVLPDGFLDNIPDFLLGLYNSLGHNFVYVGGGSGDNLGGTRTQQFTEEGVISGGYSLAVMDLKLNVAMGHGFKPITGPMVVTKAVGKVVLEIDGERAFDVYQRHVRCSVDRFAYNGMFHPIGIPCVDGYIIRDPIQVDSSGAIKFVSEVPKNSIVTIMGCSADELIKTAESVAEKAISGVKNPKFAFVFDCVSRSWLLKDRFKEEIDRIVNVLNVPIVGFLTFGEVYGCNSVPMFHNKSIVIGVGGSK